MNGSSPTGRETFACWDAIFAEWRRTLHSQLRLKALLCDAGEHTLADDTFATVADITVELVDAAERAGVTMGWAYCPEEPDFALPGLN